jgi:transposase
MRYYDEETLADLLCTLPAPPQAWVKAAQEIPLARKGLDDIVERAREDQAFRDALIADLETALERAGYETNPALAEAVRARLSL